MDRFWKFSNSAGSDSAELLLYGVIASDSWWDDVVSPKQFNDDLAALGDVKNIKLRINSPGGDVFAAAAIYNSLKNHAAKVTTYVDGLAASSASVVAMAGDKVIMPATAMMMIHNPSAYVAGDAGDLRASADVLDKVRDSIVAAYADKTGKSAAELINLMNSETWMTASDAVDMGFADEVDSSKTTVASMRGNMLIVNGLGFDAGAFLTIPRAYISENNGSAMPEPMKETKMTETIVNVAADEPAAVTPTTETPPEAVTPDATVDVVDPVENARADERARIQAIRALAFDGIGDVIDAAITDGLTVEQTALKILQSESFKTRNAADARVADARAIDGVSASAKVIDPATCTMQEYADWAKARY